MKKIGLYGLLFMIIASCGEKKKTGGHTGSAATEETAAQSGDFYRRYGGTVAGQPVVVHLQRMGNKLSGSYYYTSQGKTINLYNTDDTTNDSNYLLTEVPFGSNDGNYAHWDLQPDGDNLKGEWTSADGKKEYPVVLTEQYPEGSYRLQVKYYEASRTLIEGREEPAATFTAAYIVPAASVGAEDADFIMSVIKKEFGCDTISSDADACIRKTADAYLQDYRNGLADMDTATLSSPINNYASDRSLRVGYNDNGLLVIEDFNADYSGGAHGNYSSGYICADVKQHRIWKLEDILTVDSSVLKPLLDVAARDYFGLGLNDALAGRMLVEEVPVTGNVFISDKGISFVYNPYEIASFADGTVALFISYDKLKALLTPAFISRMHLFGAGGGSA